MLKKIESFSHRLSEYFEWIAIVGLLLVMVVTCVDVLGTKLFLKPVPGALDFVILAQAIAIAFAGAITLIHGRHVRVTFFLRMLPTRVRSIIEMIMVLFGLGLFVLAIWQLYILARYFQRGGEETMEIGLPLYPFVYGIAVALIPVCLVLLVAFFQSLSKAEK